MTESKLREALEAMVEEKCDYMRINNLGDPEESHTIKMARRALACPRCGSQMVNGRCVMVAVPGSQCRAEARAAHGESPVGGDSTATVAARGANETVAASTPTASTRCPNPGCEDGEVVRQVPSDLGGYAEFLEPCPVCNPGGTGKRDAPNKEIIQGEVGKEFGAAHAPTASTRCPDCDHGFVVWFWRDSLRELVACSTCGGTGKRNAPHVPTPAEDHAMKDAWDRAKPAETALNNIRKRLTVSGAEAAGVEEAFSGAPLVQWFNGERWVHTIYVPHEKRWASPAHSGAKDEGVPTLNDLWAAWQASQARAGQVVISRRDAEALLHFGETALNSSYHSDAIARLRAALHPEKP